MVQTYNVPDAAKKCFCHVDTIRKYIREGILPACKVGRSYIIEEIDLAALIKKLKMERSQAALLNRSGQQCQLNKEMEYGTLILQHQAVQELDAALGLKTKN